MKKNKFIYAIMFLIMSCTILFVSESFAGGQDCSKPEKKPCIDCKVLKSTLKNHGNGIKYNIMTNRRQDVQIMGNTLGVRRNAIVNMKQGGQIRNLQNENRQQDTAIRSNTMTNHRQDYDIRKNAAGVQHNAMVNNWQSMGIFHNALGVQKNAFKNYLQDKAIRYNAAVNEDQDEAINYNASVNEQQDDEIAFNRQTNHRQDEEIDNLDVRVTDTEFVNHRQDAELGGINSRLDNMDEYLTELSGRIDKAVDEAHVAAAVGIASGAHAWNPNHKGAQLSMGVGTYGGMTAGSLAAGARITGSTFVNVSVTKDSLDGYGVGGGLLFQF